MSRSGSATRSIGRVESDASPTSRCSPAMLATTPIVRRMVVPELPHSSGDAEALRRSGSLVMARMPSSSETLAPRAATIARVDATSSPCERPRIVEVPFVNAASNKDRWEIDLSPGDRTSPSRRDAGATSTWSCMTLTGRSLSTGTLGSATPQHRKVPRRSRPRRSGPPDRPRRCGRSRRRKG